MKRFFKILGVVILSLIGLVVLLFLLGRFVFRNQILGFVDGKILNERVELLRAAGPYTEAGAPALRFTYETSDPALQRVRDHFRLDTLGGKTTWERATRLGRAVAQAIPHGNPDSVPDQRNAITLWDYYQKTKTPLNCRHHSIILNELLLAADIDSRYVTCMPADSTDNDCHVVNIVWLSEKQKWAMIDSDQNFYVTDPTGTQLDLREMRERLIAGEELVQHRLYGNKKRNDYLSYMAKNLYWFTCIEASAFGCENDAAVRSIHLIPENFEGYKFWNRRENVVTSDAAGFWKAPSNSDSTI
ncbi:transglutaminase domain-containing protein [uncultured Alistipes sp.]|jgi:transglutaminase-like superfamily|uniref:transglutaminase domain-containing protein n=1 Tax=uncultured Alistipes sp. TaxID=538949 RepID=UPI0025FC910E|nr:transglutaminase domain-containing protein [uncultured Alistipes sp.]